MKMIVKLAVLFAILLLLTGVAFAEAPCFCYEVTCTNLENGDRITHNVGICFAPSGEEAYIYSICGNEGPMSLFFDPMKKEALAYASYGSPFVGYLKFHGDWLHVLNGIVYCNGDRWTIRGHKVNEGNCIFG